jgi:hypothetical protein
VATNYQHTPGPWKCVSAEFKKGGLVAFEVRMPEQVLCKRDADLISAAPELLEAAKLALDQLPQFPGDCPFSRLRDAVARAEGRDE